MYAGDEFTTDQDFDPADERFEGCQAARYQRPAELGGSAVDLDDLDEYDPYGVDPIARPLVVVR